MNVECSNNSMLVDHVCIWKKLKLKTTSSQKTSCRTLKCPTASFLATGGFIKLFHKIPWFSNDNQIFQIPWFFHAWNFFSDFPGFPWFPELVGTLLIPLNVYVASTKNHLTVRDSSVPIMYTCRKIIPNTLSLIWILRQFSSYNAYM